MMGTATDVQFTLTERWRPIAGYEGLYSVSDMGRVRAEAKIIHQVNRTCSNKQRVMRPGRSLKSGYLSVGLTSASGARSTHYVHSLVLSAFECPRPSGMEACHRDGNRQNNRLTNLRWDTRAGNHADKRDHGTSTSGERHPMAKLSDEAVREMRRLRSTGMYYRQIAEAAGVTYQTAFRAINKKSWSHLK